MRHLFLALMIVLLPLRGWMGDAMATDMAISMAASVANTTKTIAAGAYQTSAGSHFDHKTPVSVALAAPTPQIPAPTRSITQSTTAVQAHVDCNGHASGHPTPLAEKYDSSEMQDWQGKHCKPCQSCQACHTVALSAALPAVTGTSAEPVTPQAVAAEFTSALTVLGQKPPIS